MTTIDLCELRHADTALAEKVRQQLPEEEFLFDLSELYKSFGDSTRIRILYVLLETEMCVCDLALVLDMTVSAISHQLRVLKQAGLVKGRREGKTVFYSLSDEHVRTILDKATEHLKERT